MAKPELGTKRVCPETGKKFYDLGKDPIVSPYSGKSYPLSFFDDAAAPAKEKEEAAKETEAEKTEDLEVEVETDEGDDGAEIVSLEDAEDDMVEDDKNLPDLGDNTDDDIAIDDDDDSDDDTFLATDDDDDDDVSDIIDVSSDEEDL